MSEPLLSSSMRVLVSPDPPCLATYAQQAYLEYALSVVKGRALPDVADGQKPVQRRILYAMQRMGLGHSGPQRNQPAKPVKSARVVGDVLGRYHPHGDTAAYDALVRMAQDFSQRYPLIDGQGNFGSRDGDGAAAMRYTEARLSKITALLLDEIDQGTVDFVANYDGSTTEPRQLPGRLPFVLLNGASGIAVGMATEIPSHNLGEVARAAVALLKNPDLSEAEWSALLPGPDYPGGGQIISTPAEIAEAYRSGRGSLKVRARGQTEELARGQWQWVVNELPPGVSAQKVLEEIEELTNPKIKAGKKALSQEQLQLKASVLALLDGVRDESSKDAPVRLVFEPKTRAVSQQVLVAALLAHTSLETSAPINLTLIGLDGRPVPKSLRQIMSEWLAFRQTTLTRRTQHRLAQVRQRIHLLEGRRLVWLHLDAVIALVRDAEQPKQALMQTFGLTEVQADDILEIRLRQLARLEALQIEQEWEKLRAEQQQCEEILAQPTSLRRLMVREIEADAKTFADPRRTLIQAEKKAVVEIKVVDEPVTVVVSRLGWVRTRQGHGHDAAALGFKAGDGLYATFECRSVDSLLVFGSQGRVYSVAVAALPGGRGDGQPITALIDLEPGTQVQHFVAAALGTWWLLSGSGGCGFLAKVEDMLARNKAGKAFVSLNAGETLCPPALVQGGGVMRWAGTEGTVVCPPLADTGGALGPSGVVQGERVCVLSARGRLLTFALSELRHLPKGGRGLQLLALEDEDRLVGAVAYQRSVYIEGVGRGGKHRTETLESRSLGNAQAPRGRKGKEASFAFKPQRLWRWV